MTIEKPDWGFLECFDLYGNLNGLEQAQVLIWLRKPKCLAIVEDEVV